MGTAAMEGGGSGDMGTAAMEGGGSGDIGTAAKDGGGSGDIGTAAIVGGGNGDIGTAALAAHADTTSNATTITLSGRIVLEPISFCFPGGKTPAIKSPRR